jgi:hypothetical protein
MLHSVNRKSRRLLTEKAPDPDGFTDTFYKTCCEIIKHDVVQAFQCLHNQTTSPLYKLNGALLTLIPKKLAAELPSDFRPIILIHSFAKLVTKVLALRLTPHLDVLISSS